MQRRTVLKSIIGLAAIVGSGGAVASVRWDLKPIHRGSLVMTVIPADDLDDRESDLPAPVAMPTEKAKAVSAPEPPSQTEFVPRQAAFPIAVFIGVSAALYASADAVMGRIERGRRTAEKRTPSRRAGVLRNGAVR